MLEVVSTKSTDASLTPFLRWPGGKRWIASVIASEVRKHLRGTYIEPFLGGGAVFFRLCPESALLGDLNPHLVETYLAIQEAPEDVIEILRKWDISERTFYRLRTWTPISRSERAARFLYLNRTAFSGMYRENRNGQYNVPFGGGTRTHRVLVETDVLTRAGKTLHSARLSVGDFSTLLSKAQKGDVVYCDPPYSLSMTSTFNRYNGKIFDWADQVRLAADAWKAHARGVTVIVSNASDPAVYQLYSGADVRILERPSLVSRTRAGRGVVNESLFVLPT